MKLFQAIRVLNRPKVMGQLRHLMNTVGALMAARGYVTDIDWQIGAGVGLALIAFAGSILAKEKSE